MSVIESGGLGVKGDGHIKIALHLSEILDERDKT